MRNERGQAVFVTVLFLFVLLGCAALTLDVGMWYRAQRQAQATADAAALAGAQALPANPALAVSSAQLYADKNGGGVPAGGITLRSDFLTSDTVSVSVRRTSPSIFASVLGQGAVTVHAEAAARAGVPDEVDGVAPIVVNKLHPLLSGAGCPCFKTETTIPLGKTGVPGQFGIVDLDNSAGKGVPDLADWIADGYDGYLPLGNYDADPGAKFNSSDILDALASRLGTELLFPVYDTLSSPPRSQYHIIGWVAFHLDCVGLTAGDTDCVNHHGNNDSLTGYFTRVIWNGLQSKGSKGLPDFGVYTVSLVN